MMQTLSDFRPVQEIWQIRFPGSYVAVAVAVFAEYRGQRFFIGNVPSFPEATASAEALKRVLPRANYFITDVYNSTRIDGIASDLHSAYAEDDAAWRIYK